MVRTIISCFYYKKKRAIEKNERKKEDEWRLMGFWFDVSVTVPSDTHCSSCWCVCVCAPSMCASATCVTAHFQ